MIVPDERQLMALTHRDGPCMVLAGPGSGKTFVIVSRIKYLIEHEHVPPDQILVITFTRAAATQMRERFFALSGKDDSRQVTFGTFHSIYFGILKNARKIGPESILKAGEKREIIASCLTNDLLSDIHSREEFEDLIDRISAMTERRQADKTFEPVIDAYRAEKNRRSKVDFTDMLTGCLECLESDDELRDKYSRRYRYILVDEFQDINPVQYEILKILDGTGNNLFAVGDDDQAIYGFRGSSPRLMFAFERDHPGCKRIVLNNNYRSTDAIVKTAARLIRHNHDRFRKDLKIPEREGPVPALMAFRTRSAQYRWIIRFLKLQQNTDDTAGTTAVLCRTNHGLSVIRELFEGDHEVIRDLKVFARAVRNLDRGCVARSDLLLITARMNLPITREMAQRASDADGTVSWERLIHVSAQSWMADEIWKFVDLLRKAGSRPPLPGLKVLCDNAGYRSRILESAGSDEDIEEIDEWLQFAFDSAEGCLTWKQWQAELAVRQKKAVRSDRIRLMTMHGAKGLEFDTVIIPDLNEGCTPHPYGDTEEERRLFYVAVTRAAGRLILTSVVSGREHTGTPSRFLSECGLKYAKIPCV